MKMRKVYVVICLVFFTCSLAVTQNISIAYEIGFSDVAFTDKSAIVEYDSRIGNAVYLLGEWPTKNEQLTFLTGLVFGKHQLKEKIGPLTFLEDINVPTGPSRTAFLEREITLKFIGIPTLLRFKKDWKRIQGFITGGPIFRRLNSLHLKEELVYTDGEIGSPNSTNTKAIYDFSFYGNIGCSKRLNQRLSLFLLTSINVDLHNGKKEDQKGLGGAGNIIHPAVAVGLGYDL